MNLRRFPRTSSIFERLSKLIEKYEINAAHLILEITETQLLDYGAKILQSLEVLRKLGIRIWIDDFGSGYSSLGYLVRFPIHALKIDQTFIRGFNQDEKNKMIANAIVSLGKNLGVEVIAEGVETQDQLDLLGRNGMPLWPGPFLLGGGGSRCFGRLAPQEGQRLAQSSSAQVSSRAVCVALHTQRFSHRLSLQPALSGDTTS